MPGTFCSCSVPRGSLATSYSERIGTYPNKQCSYSRVLSGWGLVHSSLSSFIIAAFTATSWWLCTFPRIKKNGVFFKVLIKTGSIYTSEKQLKSWCITGHLYACLILRQVFLMCLFQMETFKLPISNSFSFALCFYEFEDGIEDFFLKIEVALSVRFLKLLSYLILNLIFDSTLPARFFRLFYISKLLFLDLKHWFSHRPLCS